MESNRVPMSMHSMVISFVIIGLGTIIFGILVIPYDPEVSIFLMVLGLLLSASAVFFFISYKRSVKTEEDLNET
ncbi:MAG: hypothetical protein QXP55_03805 [Nitrososphaerales archaeon]